MALTTNERQSIFREKMYKAGFKPMQIWVKRKETAAVKMDQKEFITKLKRLTAKWDENKLYETFSLFIKIIKSRKEEEKIVKKLK
jgi:hypothetical protein